MSRRLRCAIYTRKSTEEGLDQTFNTLDAQREACEAYVLSQVGEGWEALPDHYDDGGWSGGNMNRPALKRLLEDVGKGRVDIVVVYKADRLTRSLMDFARIVETFDANNLSFVSVTQAFNTTSSMGRLTLNVLLSFAQFERDVTGERIRDKIAASKARGMWMGGNIPLGYDLGDRCLIVNDVEAETVRHIYHRYLKLKSLPALVNDLAAQGIHSKRWTSRKGVAHGGLTFTCGGLSHILKNRLYRGDTVHKGKAYPGDHDAVIDQPLFDSVQAQLVANHHCRVTRKTRAAACPLTGKILDADGQPMRPSFSYGRGKRVYRYYVSECLLPNGRNGDDSNRQGQRLPAERLEKLIAGKLLVIFSNPVAPDALFEAITKVVAMQDNVRITLKTASFVGENFCKNMLLGRAQHHIDSEARLEEGQLHLKINTPPARTGRTIVPKLHHALDQEFHDALAGLVRTCHRKLVELNASPLHPAHHERMQPPTNDWARARIAIGFLAPDIQKALLQGTVPDNFNAELLLSRKIPHDWDQQRQLFGMVV